MNHSELTENAWSDEARQAAIEARKQTYRGSLRRKGSKERIHSEEDLQRIKKSKSSIQKLKGLGTSAIDEKIKQYKHFIESRHRGGDLVTEEHKQRLRDLYMLRYASTKNVKLNGEESMNRNEVIDDLVGNCDCWGSDEGREALENMSDDLLVTLYTNAQKCKHDDEDDEDENLEDNKEDDEEEDDEEEEEEEVENDFGSAAQQAAAVIDMALEGRAKSKSIKKRKEYGGKKWKMTSSTKSKAKDSKGSKPRKSKEDDDDEGTLFEIERDKMGRRRKTKSYEPTIAGNAWYDLLPEEAQTIFNEALENQEREKQVLVQKLTANVRSNRREEVEFLYGKPLQELRRLASYMPGKGIDLAVNYGSAYAGLGGTPIPIYNSEHNRQDSKDMEPPTINYGELSCFGDDK